MDQKWQACLKYSKRDQNGLPEWFLTIWDPFGPNWTLFGHFRQKWICCPKWTKYGLAKVLRSKKSIFVWNGQKGSRWVQRGAKWSQTLRLTILVLLDPVGWLWSIDKLAMFVNFRFKIDQFFLPSLPSHERWTPIQEKAHHQVSYVWPA